MEQEPVERPKFSCAICGRLTTVVMGARGPVKTPLTITRTGNFLFCSECRAVAVIGERSCGGVTMQTVTVTDGPMKGHCWITSAS